MRLCLALPFALILALPVQAEELTLRVLTYNIWYGGAQVTFDRTIAAILAADADIVGLHELEGQTARIAEEALLIVLAPSLSAYLHFTT